MGLRLFGAWICNVFSGGFAYLRVLWTGVFIHLIGKWIYRRVDFNYYGECCCWDDWRCVNSLRRKVR